MANHTKNIKLLAPFLKNHAKFLKNDAVIMHKLYISDDYRSSTLYMIGFFFLFFVFVFCFLNFLQIGTHF